MSARLIGVLLPPPLMQIARRALRCVSTAWTAWPTCTCPTLPPVSLQQQAAAFLLPLSLHVRVLGDVLGGHGAVLPPLAVGRSQRVVLLQARAAGVQTFAG